LGRRGLGLSGERSNFISVAALVAPSHRVVVILLVAALFYSAFFWASETFEEFPYSLLGVHDPSSRAYFYLSIVTGAIGVAAGAFSALRITARWDTPWWLAETGDNQRQRYKGTAPYQDIDLDRKTFFGRDDESRSLLSLVLAERLVVLFAKSGMGKSSLINAGLAEPLRQMKYFPIVVRLNDLTQGLAHSLLDGVRHAAKHARIDIVGGEGTSPWRFFKTNEFWSEHNDLLRPVLILDQFEEIFTLHSKEVRSEFIGQLGELVRGRSRTPRNGNTPALIGQSLDDTAPDVKVVIALREDFLANLEELASEIPAILHNRFRLGPLSLDAARAAIIQPARVGNEAFQTATFTYQEAAVERILAFLAKRRLGVETTTSDEVEPVQLQIICHYLEDVVRTRQAAGDADIELQISEADLGGEEHMQQVLEGFYDRTIAGVRPRWKSAAVRRLCETRLISRSGRRLTEDHEEITRRFKISEELLRHLVDARLLRAEARLGSTFYEVSHDRLVEPILQSRRKRLVKRRWVDAAAVVLVMTVMGSHAYEYANAWQLGREQIQLESMLFSPEPEKAIDAINGLVTRHHYRVQDVVKKMETRHLNPSVLVILSMDSAWRGRELATLSDHEGAVNFVAFSTDGQRLVSASDDGAARVWRVDGRGKPVVLKGNREPLESAVFSPDGQRVVTASVDGKARVWRADGSGTPAVLQGHEKPVVSASFSRDGQRVVTASRDGTARVWQADGSGTPVVLEGHKDQVGSAVFSPDGQRVVTASHDGTARVWQADGSGMPIVLEGHHDQVWRVVFSPDGQYVVTASRDGTARVWQADGSGTPVVLEGHSKSVYSATLSPDGQRVVTTSFDGTARVWRVDGSGTPAVLRGHEKLVRTAAFSSDGKMLATAGDDGKVFLWNMEKTEPLAALSGHAGEINHVAFNPNGKTLASASEDGTVILWNREVHKPAEPHMKQVLGHIEKYYVSNLNSSSSNRAGVPTLLGALISTLDDADKFGDPEISDQAQSLRTRVIEEYEKLRLGTKPLPDSECGGDNRQPLNSLDSRTWRQRDILDRQLRKARVAPLQISSDEGSDESAVPMFLSRSLFPAE
jgi:WD40 repeat protein